MGRRRCFALAIYKALKILKLSGKSLPGHPVNSTLEPNRDYIQDGKSLSAKISMSCWKISKHFSISHIFVCFWKKISRLLWLANNGNQNYVFSDFLPNFFHGNSRLIKFTEIAIFFSSVTTLWKDKHQQKYIYEDFHKYAT